MDELYIYIFKYVCIVLIKIYIYFVIKWIFKEFINFR